ncbi:hypothetical protein L2E82_45604 [Cichorium intybus]|uniref:Uncharacterized protein n=1 Tax=Cichorium intybus TaxID=13427 RepID=A0ACB8ZTJ4_CICIN|nr:hypothetical protein L2E82_45604 [Cichorium intybus]
MGLIEQQRPGCYTYSGSSVERIQNLRDQVRQISKGTSTVADFGRKFKSLCDQLAAIGHPVDDSDKIHCFLYELGASFESFSTAIRASLSPLNLRDLIAQAEGHEIFLRSLHGSGPPPVAFNTQTTPTHNKGRGRSFRSGRGRGRRPPYCQLCHTKGHYASACPQLATFASHAPVFDTEFAKAFHVQCHATSSGPDWFVESGATDHMTTSTDSITQPTVFSGSSKVAFGDGNVLPISHIGHSLLNNGIQLWNVLVVPKLTKNLLSISRLTSDNNMDVLFSQPYFYIQDRKMRWVLAQGRCDRGLYVLSTKPQAFVATRSKLKAPYELWHSRLGHVSFDTISLLNKMGHLSVTSILPKPIICSPCQLAKAHRLPFEQNDKRSLNILELVHCDLWGPSPVCSADGYHYYVTFLDDYSRFMWFYPLKSKSSFAIVLNIFVTFVQTQFSRKMKVFQSDGGTEFLNHDVKKLLDDNGTFHRISCPYTP